MNFFKFIVFFFIFCNLSIHSNAELDIKATTAILKDFHSNEILYEKNPDMKIYPASMTKIMTSIIAFDFLKKKEATLDEKVVISEKAWRMSKSGYSSMFIMLNDRVSIEDLLKGIIITSGNDACVALAEGLTGSEEEFVELMNKKSQELGMVNTKFSNSSGINDVNNYSTVSDIMKMSDHIIREYPEYYTYFKEKSFTWDRTGGDPITQGNRNPLLYKDIGADGLKTGYLAVEKYSLASSIKLEERRLIAVGSGFRTKGSRSRESERLLKWGLLKYDTIKVASKNVPIGEAEVWHGKTNKVKIETNKSIYVTVPKRKKKLVKAVIEYKGPIHAPIKKGQKIGMLKVYVKNDLKHELDIFASEDIKKVNIFSRLIKSFNYLVWGDV